MANYGIDLAETAEVIKAQELRLKHKNEEELFTALLQSGEAWTGEQRTGIEAAYRLAHTVHRDDTYRDQPYVYHLLRVANRLTGYLHINDPELITAALLHDSVEDHPAELLTGRQHIPEDPGELQRAAFGQIAALFSPRVAAMVASVTNAPAEAGRKETYEEWLDRYARKVESAATTPEGCLIKFADWCDNGLGLIHSEEPEGSETLAHFKRKYVRALPVFERRFQDNDILKLLDEEARVYVFSQLALGRERLAP